MPSSKLGEETGSHQEPKLLNVPGLANGDAFVFVNLPAKAHVGCDTMIGTTDEETEGSDLSGAETKTGFCGFRDIPQGPHFAWASAPGAMSRAGCWFMAAKPWIMRTKQWNRFDEALEDFKQPTEDAAIRDRLAASFPQLIPYAAGTSQTGLSSPTPRLSSTRYGAGDENTELWSNLTSCITGTVLARIASTTDTGAAAEWLFTTVDAATENVVKRPARPGDQSEFYFSFAKDDLDAYRLLAAQGRPGTEGRPDTNPATDSGDTTGRLLAVIEHPDSNTTDSDIIGELQFAFVTGIVLSNLACLEQWWHFVLRIFLRARHLVARRPGLCRLFLTALHAQLTYVERFTVAKIPRLSSRNGQVSEVNDTGRDDESGSSGASIFDVKPQGAVRLRASLAAFRKQFQFSKGDKAALADAVVEKSVLSTSIGEAAAAEAFMDLEALLWKYGWNLSADGEVAGGLGADNSRNARNDDDEDDEVELYDTPLHEGAQVGTRQAKSHSALSDSDDDDDDYQPVVVEVDDDGREVGLLSWD